MTIIFIAKKITIDYITGKKTIVIMNVMLIRRPSELGAIIASARRARGLRQEDLAARLGVSRVWLGLIERGKSTARIDMVFRVLNELDVNLSADVAPLPAAAGVDVTSSVPVFDIDAIADTGLAPSPVASRKPAGRKRGRK